MYSTKTITASYFLITAGVLMLVIWLFLLLPGGGGFLKIQILRLLLPFIGILSTVIGWLVLQTVKEALEEVSLLRVELSQLSKRLDKLEG
ncbi:hypothetical protein D3P08_17345 [Paenibacillus nanensis]|uniref:Uncharacterized protein n=1 Tax=Paenibacillus nanensis TaxID=393251 RepID=A0A3A1USM2_9BACL|nr:hypothetical protein [Paenibacillus nanensis]RIX51235.1 hypothetical protein D3P08_17345 [Paenibacillus nanensis]